MDLIWKAKLFAQEKHKNHRDDDGFFYFDSHLTQVVNILMNLTDDVDILSSAWLHDTIEDTETNYEELIKEFGIVIADLVMEVTHDGKKDNIGFYFSRLKSEKAILIKFADRLSNLSRMNSWSPERKKHYLKKSKFWKEKP